MGRTVASRGRVWQSGDVPRVAVTITSRVPEVSSST
jgi:hypothetical protein